MIIKMMSGDTYTVSESEAMNVQGKSGLVIVPSIDGMLNISSIESIMPDEVALANATERTLSDGTRAEKKFGSWVLAGTDKKIDQKHYPELRELDKLKKQVHEPL